jgi:5-oxoprolinase (ATP-hydrolysing)
VRREAAQLVAEGHRVAAVALLHADKSPQHEAQVARLARECGFEHVSCSAELAPFITLRTRAQTAVVDAALAPVIQRYLAQIRGAVGRGRISVMTSAGGLVAADAFHAKDSLLSGPAGGIAGAAQVGRQVGFERLLAFDMGGTSTDVARYEGDFEYVFEHSVGDANLLAPALAIESVAAGGGSVCTFDGIRLKVGPESAGASPGPACYGAGGPLTLTDINLLAGRLEPQRFEIPIDTGAAVAALDAVREKLRRATGEAVAADELIDGFLEIADERMADAIRRISLRKGYDPSEYALVAFGGAGPQHALEVAQRLGVRTVIIPEDAALLSAVGLSAAVVERFAEAQVLEPVATVSGELEARLEQLAEEAVRRVVSEGVERDQVVVRRQIGSLRFVGQDSTIEVELEPGVGLTTAFARRHEELYGHRPEDREVELVSLRVVASTRSGQTRASRRPGQGGEVLPRPAGTTRARLAGGWREVPVFHQECLGLGAVVDGPCVLHGRFSSSIVPHGWRLAIHSSSAVVARRLQLDHRLMDRERPEAVQRELFTHRFETVVREMGEQLRRTAVSVNIKERLDFSCAMLDADGQLVVNAPHIPVHLGSLGLCVRRLIGELSLAPGETAITNHPGYGGSHLPDVTVVSPVDDRCGRRIGYVASRAHHAEIGGCQPGSMPPAARCLAEEGVVIAPMRLVHGGVGRWDVLQHALEGADAPSRAVADNLADVRAALAANRHGVRALAALAERFSAETVSHYTQALAANATRAAESALRRMGDGVYRAEEVLDDGARFAVTVSLRDGRCTVDVTDCDPVHRGNLNATPAIVRSAVLYVLRLLVSEPLPLNEGLLEPVDIRLRRGSLLDPEFPIDPRQCPAVVGGNVETSQRLVNALIRAFGVAASSQGTMNNVVFGNERLSYYETVGGGCGAGPGFAGASAVHSHMTNTRITDPEVLEHRYPVRVEAFAVRQGSGGDGRWRGGDGIVRELRFLEPVTLSVLTQHRREGPEGMEGGRRGAPGAQRVVRTDGAADELGAVDSREVGPGDLFVLETPGGGGYGEPEPGGEDE